MATTQRENLNFVDTESGSGARDPGLRTLFGGSATSESRKSKAVSRCGLSLMELMAIVAILGAIMVLIVPRIGARTEDAKTHACDLNQGEIELQCQLWRRAIGSFPAADLSVIGADTSYFPAALPTCPVDGSAYTIDPTTGRVVGHGH